MRRATCCLGLLLLPIAATMVGLWQNLGPARQFIATHGAPWIAWDAEEDFVIATAATSNHFEQLANMVGSVHAHEQPGRELVVFDLGLLPRQLQQMAAWRGVRIRRLPFDAYPPHVALIHTFAFKSALLAEMAAEYPGRCFFYMDAGVELARALAPEAADLSADGYFFTLQAPLALEYTHEAMLAWLGVRADLPALQGARHVAGTVNGFCAAHEHGAELLKLSHACAMDPDCIAPVGSGVDNHMQDQSMWSLLVYPRGLRVHEERRYWWGPRDADVAEPPADRPWTLRRRSGPHEYVDRVELLASPDEPVNQEAGAIALMQAGRGPLVVDLSHPKHDQPVLVCLRAHLLDWQTACAAQLHAHCGKCKWGGARACPREESLDEGRRREECTGVLCSYVEPCPLGSV